MKNYQLLPTKNSELFRVVDEDGNWDTYFHEGAHVYLPSVTAILDKGYARPELEAWLSNHTAEERDEILERTGDRGDKVHRAIDLILTTGMKFDRNTKVYSRLTGQDELLTKEEWAALLSFKRFWEAHGVQLIFSEASIYNLEVGFAGTVDAFLVLTRACTVKTCKCEDLVGKVGIWDWKTSSGVRASYSAQCGAYAAGQNLEEYLPKDTAVEYIGILRLGTKHKTTNGYELKTFEVEESYRRFLAAKTIFDFNFEPFTDEDIVDVEDSIELEIVQYEA